jgi:hypothetical protein
MMRARCASLRRFASMGPRRLPVQRRLCPTASARAVLELLAEVPPCIDAYLLSWREDRVHGEMVERLVAAMPAAGIIAAKEFPLGAPDEDPRPLAWRMAVAEIVRTDREEAVGGRRHAKPAVAPR